MEKKSSEDKGYRKESAGIVIRSYDYGEGHRIVSLFTRRLGKVKAVARGSRKTKSRYASLLEPGSENIFSFYRKPGKDLYTLTGCSAINQNYSIRSDMARFGYLSLILEVVDLLYMEDDPDMNLYKCLKEALGQIEGPFFNSEAWLFVFKALKYAGYRLDFFRCGSCFMKFPEKAVFSPESGGIICEKCSRLQEGWSVSGKALRSIRRLHRREMEFNREREIGKLVVKYIKYEFGRELKSMEFLKLFERTKCISRT